MINFKFNPLHHQLLYYKRFTVKSRSIYLTSILFIALFATILVSLSLPSFVYSLSNSANNAAKTDMTNQSVILRFKELQDKVKEFILNDVVNKSKAALVVGFIDSNGTKYITLEIFQKKITCQLMGVPFLI